MATCGEGGIGGRIRAGARRCIIASTVACNMPTRDHRNSLHWATTRSPASKRPSCQEAITAAKRPPALRAQMSAKTGDGALSRHCQQGLSAETLTPCSSMLMACHAHKKPEAKFAHLTLGIFCEWLLSLRAGGRPPDWSSRVFGAGNAVSNVWKARHRRSCLPHQADPCGQQSAEKSDNCMVAHMLRHEARTLSCA